MSKAAARTRVSPPWRAPVTWAGYTPMDELIQNVIANGCTILVCPPCAKARGLSEGDLLDGAIITGSGAMHELIKEGAATLSF